MLRTYLTPSFSHTPIKVTPNSNHIYAEQTMPAFGRLDLYIPNLTEPSPQSQPPSCHNYISLSSFPCSLVFIYDHTRPLPWKSIQPTSRNAHRKLLPILLLTSSTKTLSAELNPFTPPATAPSKSTISLAFSSPPNGLSFLPKQSSNHRSTRYTI